MPRKKDAGLWTQFYKVKCEVNIILLYVIYFHLKRFIVFTGDLMRPWEQKLEKMLVVNFKMFCVYTYRRETLRTELENSQLVSESHKKSFLAYIFGQSSYL